MSEYISIQKIDMNKNLNLSLMKTTLYKILIQKKIFKYIHLQKFDTNQYLNIFVSKKIIRTSIQINICIKNIRMYEYWNIFGTLCYIDNIRRDIVPK